MKAPIIMIKLTGRSPRLVRRWRDLGLLPGFSKLTEQSPPQTIREHWTMRGENGISQRPSVTELWGNVKVSDELIGADNGYKFRTPRFGG